MIDERKYVWVRKGNISHCVAHVFIAKCSLTWHLPGNFSYCSATPFCFKPKTAISPSYNLYRHMEFPLSYTPNEGLHSANHKDRKLGVFDRKLEGSHCPFL